MDTRSIGAATIIVGCVIFFIGAGLPVSMRVFPMAMADAAKRMDAITASLTQWQISQVGFGLGSLVAALGVGIVAFAARDKSFAPLLFLAAVGLAVGAVLWSIHVYQRAVDPQAFVSGTLVVWYFAVYTVLTLIGILLIGVAALSMGLPSWVGWLTIGAPVVLFVVYLVGKDMPPFVHYILLLIVGIAISRLG